MWEKENSIGAAHLQAEGLEGVFNIAKLFAELASQMAQREIQVEDLIIQTDRGTLKPGMNEEEAQQFEADIRDVFMDPENKKAFRVFMEDPDGKRTLIFESKEGKIAPDLYDLRRSMMQFYAKTDAEQFGQNFEEYFDEVVIKTGKAEEQDALGISGEAPDLDPSNATIDTVSSEPDKDLDFEPDTETMSAQASNNTPSLNVDLSDSTVDVVAQPSTYKHVEPVANADIQKAMELPQQMQQDKNETFIMSAIMPTLKEANLTIDENLHMAENLATEYSTVEGIPNVDTFLQEVQQVGEQITEIQSQMNAVADGSIALALSGAGELEGWGEAVQATLAQDLPNISERLQSLSQQLVDYIKERAIQDLDFLKNSLSEKFTGAIDIVGEKFSNTMESIGNVIVNEIDDVQRLLLGGKEKINDSIDFLVDNHGEDGILEGDKYILDAEYHSVTRKEDNEIIYINGYIDKSATQEDRQAIKDIPTIAKEQSQQDSETQSAGASIKR